MKFLCLSLVLGSALSSATTSTEQPNAVPSMACESYGLPSVYKEDKYHGDQVCTRADYNQYKESLQRHRIYDRLKKTQGINLVPNMKTVTCPLEVADLKHESNQQSVGYDTIWIVENTSADPVVLSYVSGEDGIEYSATNTKITPPHADPDAILLPGKWRSIMAFDGHVFHARTFDPKSNMIGPVVLQHRTGLIPVGAKFQDLECPADDPEPILPETKQIDPKFARTTPAVNRPCNTIDIGFRNMANCPLHGYYISVNGTDASSCQESFKFHLGLNNAPRDFMWGWDSPTKFEGSFVGHSFSFRSAANPSILVETVTLQPTQVIDCPDLKNKVQINKVTTVGETLSAFVPISDEGEVGKQEQLLVTLSRVDPRVMARLFNETNSNGNATSMDKGARRRLYGARVDPNLVLGIRSV